MVCGRKLKRIMKNNNNKLQERSAGGSAFPIMLAICNTSERVRTDIYTPTQGRGITKVGE